LQTSDEQYKCFRSCISVRMLVFFILALATLQSGIVLISETPNVYGQTQVTVTDINIVSDLSWTSPSLGSNLKPTTSSVMMISAPIPDNGNNNTTPFLLPSPSSGQSSGNNSPPPVDAGLASNNNNVLNSNSPPQGDNSNNNSTNTHHDSHSSSQTNIVSSNDNHVSNQHKNHKHGFTVDIINKVVSQSKQQFTGGQIPFP
jgi:hypothetical protein